MGRATHHTSEREGIDDVDVFDGDPLCRMMRNADRHDDTRDMVLRVVVMTDAA